MSDKNVEFDIYWDQLNDWVDDMSDGKFLPQFVTFAKEFGYEIRERLRKHILAQDIPWAPLAARTRRRKGHFYKYIETGFYLKHIAVDVETGPNYEVFLSVHPYGRHPTNKKMLQDVAEILETGAPKIPARPIWRPVKNEMWNYAAFRNFSLAGALQ